MSKVFLIALIFSACSFADTGRELNPNDYQKWINEGAEAIENGNFQKAYDLALPYAQAGNADAQFTVALILGWGYGHGLENPTEKQREEKSFPWHQRAAAAGHPEAVQILVDTYKNGWYGQGRDLVLSLCWAAVLDNKKQPNECEKR